MKIVVFLGPSLKKSHALEILPQAIYLPPAAHMDLMSSVRIYQPDAIALIDGVFERVPSVWHKEILYALKQGVAVYGASSMGALRVAETAAFGAIGVGEIFRRYAEEELLDDDEVALSHSDADFDFRPLTEPMVNLRATLQRALQEGVLDEALHERLLGIAKAQHFTERTFFSVLEQANLDKEQTKELLAFVRSHYVDLKGQDARELLEHLRDLKSVPVPEANFDLNPSAYFTRQERRDRQVMRPSGKVSLERVASHMALHSPDFEDLNFSALNATLVQLLAETWKVEVPQDDLLREERRFKLRLKIKEADFPAWLENNDLSQSEFEDLILQRATCRFMQRWMTREGYRGTKCTQAVLNEARTRGSYTHWANEAASFEQSVALHRPDFPTPEDGKQDLPNLVLEHLRATPCRMLVPYQEWGREAGFLYDDALKLELLRAKIARQNLRDLAFSVAEPAKASPLELGESRG